MSFGERFLAEPRLFPGSFDGGTWGAQEVVLTFPGGPYAVRGLTPRQYSRVTARWSEAVAAPPGGVPPCVATVIRADAAAFREVRLAEYTFDVEARPEGIRVAAPGWAALIEVDEVRRATLFLPVEVPGDFDGVVENFLRVVASYRLLREGGLLLHSAGIVRDGRAHLFLGRSGAGKSTLCARSAAEGLLVLSDELNVLEATPEGPVLRPVPFAGDFGRPASPPAGRFPLAGIYRLEKGPRNALRPLPPSAVAAQLLVCASFVNSDPHRRDVLFGLLDDLAGSVPCHTLESALEGRPWDAIP